MMIGSKLPSPKAALALVLALSAVGRCQPNQSVPEGIASYLPLCDQRIVTHTCHRLQGGPIVPTKVTQDLLAELLSASPGDVVNALEELGLQSEKVDVECQALCDAVVQYVMRTGGILPPTTDRICYTFRGVTKCDVEVNPSQGIREEGDAREMPEKVRPRQELRIPGDEAAAGSGDLGAKTEAMGQFGDSLPSQHTAWDLIMSVAGHFRMFPSSGQEIVHFTVEEGQGLNGTGQASAFLEGEAGDVIAQRLATARGWAATIVNELWAGHATKFINTWFHGGAYQTVFGTISRRYKWAQTQLNRGIHGVHAASNCTWVAYVINSVPHAPYHYAASTGPRCRGSATQGCAIDASGRYIVNFCQGWFGENFPYQVSTIFHELSHLTGTADLQGDVGRCKTQPISTSLENSYSYGYFAQDLVGSQHNCPLTGRSPNESGCGSYKAQGYCRTPNVAKECRYTCGTCNFPAGGGGGGVTPGGGGGCSDGDGSCPHYTPYCNSDRIRNLCKKSCGACGGGGGAGCSDGDGNCPHYKPYCNTARIRNLCKKSCRACGSSSALLV